MHVASWGTPGRGGGIESLNSEWQERARSVERKPETTSAKSWQLQKDPEKKQRRPGGCQAEEEMTTSRAALQAQVHL